MPSRRTTSWDDISSHWRVKQRHAGAAAGHQASDISGRATIAAEELVVAEHPQIAELADGAGLTPLGVDSVLRILGALLEIHLNMIDFGRFEAENGDVKPLRGQQVCQFRYFDRQALAIPPRILCDLVVGDRKCAPFRRRKSVDNDDRHFLEPELLCRLVAAKSGDEFTVFVHQ
jgi:hypothetical protein